MPIEIEEGSRTWKMRKLMCKLWTNFAKFGDPTPDHDNPLSFKWNPVQQNESKNLNLDYLIIDDVTKMTPDINKHRIDFWRETYRKWNKSFVVAKL